MVLIKVKAYSVSLPFLWLSQLVFCQCLNVCILLLLQGLTNSSNSKSQSVNGKCNKFLFIPCCNDQIRIDIHFRNSLTIFCWPVQAGTYVKIYDCVSRRCQVKFVFNFHRCFFYQLFKAPLSIQHIIALFSVADKVPFGGMCPDDTAERISERALNS